MPRPQEFDKHEAMTAAMHLFREHGYERVSIKDLEAATGLSSGSIYNSFGGKNDFFLKALSHYNETVVEKRIGNYLKGRNTSEALIELFLSLLEEANGEQHGCLLTNTAIEHSGLDTPVGAAVEAGFSAFTRAFSQVLTHGFGQSAEEAEKGATRLLALYQGLLVLIRHGHKKSDLAQIIAPEIRAITGEDK